MNFFRVCLEGEEIIDTCGVCSGVDWEGKGGREGNVLPSAFVSGRVAVSSCCHSSWDPGQGSVEKVIRAA